jgi:guanylate kinase
LPSADVPAGGTGRLVVVSGPSGAGKGTIISTALERRPDLVLSVSATTRAPRASEQDGVHYHFISQAEFRRMVAAGEFLEWAEVYGALYGTPLAPVRAALGAGRDVLLELDIQGAVQVKEAEPEAVLVFIEPPSMEDLSERLRERGTEDPESRARRIEAGHEEVKVGRTYDHIIVNDRLEEAVEDFLRILDDRKTNGRNTT